MEIASTNNAKSAARLEVLISKTKGVKHMNTSIILEELHGIIQELGKNGGSLSPSVYDTAQALRFALPQEDTEPAINWLLTQQKSDGGWGNASAPLSRDVPTLAAILAIHALCKSPTTEEIVSSGLHFLKNQSKQWASSLPEDLPVAVELVLPKLLEEAATMGLKIDPDPYDQLFVLGKRKQKIISQMSFMAGKTPAHSWEAWGHQPDLSVIDGTGGVGHSPAATALWLKYAQGRDDLIKERLAAAQYLKNASTATNIDIPGVMPTIWPITRYEQSFVLHSLLMSELLWHPAINQAVYPQIHELAGMVGSKGIGLSDFFIPDGDDTSAAIAVIYAANGAVKSSVGLSTLMQFANDNHFYAYPGEFQPSHSVTARGIHVLSLYQQQTSHMEAFILERQLPDGHWPGDKWNTSWLYTTYIVTYALQIAKTANVKAIQSAKNALATFQHDDGGWGASGKSTFIETAYAVLTLQTIQAKESDMYHRGCLYLLNHYKPYQIDDVQTWLGKQHYRVHRIDRAFELSAVFHATQEIGQTI